MISLWNNKKNVVAWHSPIDVLLQFSVSLTKRGTCLRTDIDASVEECDGVFSFSFEIECLEPGTYDMEIKSAPDETILKSPVIVY